MKTISANQTHLPGPTRLEQLGCDLEAIWGPSLALQKAINEHSREDMRAATSEAERFLRERREYLHAAFLELMRPATHKEIGLQVAGLLAAFSNASRLDKAFGPIVCADIAATRPTIGALEAAMRSLRRTPRPEYASLVPSIPEILEKVNEAESRLSIQKRSFTNLPSLVEKARQICK